jgi:hypothetical protein
MSHWRLPFICSQIWLASEHFWTALMWLMIAFVVMVFFSDDRHD